MLSVFNVGTLGLEFECVKVLVGVGIARPEDIREGRFGRLEDGGGSLLGGKEGDDDAVASVMVVEMAAAWVFRDLGTGSGGSAAVGGLREG